MDDSKVCSAPRRPVSWRLPASGLCGLKGQALAGDLAGLEVGIGGELEQHRLEGLVVDLAGCGQVALLRIGVVDGADKVFKPRGEVEVCHRALHGQRGLLDDRCAGLARRIRKHRRFVRLGAADRAHIVRLRQHPFVYDADGEFAASLDAPVDEVGAGQVDQDLVVAQDAHMGCQRPGGLFAVHGAHHDGGHGVQGKDGTDVLFHEKNAPFKTTGGWILFDTVSAYIL